MKDNHDNFRNNENVVYKDKLSFLKKFEPSFSLSRERNLLLSGKATLSFSRKFLHPQWKTSAR